MVFWAPRGFFGASETGGQHGGHIGDEGPIACRLQSCSRNLEVFRLGNSGCRDPPRQRPPQISEIARILLLIKQRPKRLKATPPRPKMQDLTVLNLTFSAVEKPQ